MVHSQDHEYSGDLSEKMKRNQEYIKALEGERRKVLVFQRELPLCLDLITQAIEACKQQLSGTTTSADYSSHGGGRSERSEQTSGEPILEEFMPIKKLSSSESNQTNDDDGNNCSNKEPKKSDWLRSAQLWNQTPDPEEPIREGSPEKISDANKEVSLHPLKKGIRRSGDLNTKQLLPASTSCSTGHHDGEKNRNKKEEKEGKLATLKKGRRCWSPELHRRFLQALQHLGGSSATPKQIRELMKVDGLTNDEVKSHLQKYRLHTRRPSNSASNNTAPQPPPPPPPPQFVVVGGIWVPPSNGVVPNCNNGIYTSMLPGNFKESSESPKLRNPSLSSSHSNDRDSHRSDSPVTSSSMHTTFAAY